MVTSAQRSPDKAMRLLERLAGRRSLLIVLQDNPDPDALAAGAGLRRIANARSDLPCSIAHGGVIGRAENRALAGYLGVKLRPIEDVDAARFDAVALVDTQPGTGNNSLPATRLPDVVIDHHPLRRETRAVPFTDVRSRYGAVSTILFEYLQALDIVPEPPLATALLYAIRTDTQDLGRRAARADVAAVEALYPLANTRMLGEIQRPSLSADYYRALDRALRGAEVRGRSILAALGEVDNPDMMGEAADLLLRHAGTEWVLCHGVHGGRLLLSLRTSQDRRKAGDVMRRIVAGLGTGGGHASSAGGQVVLDPGGADDAERIVARLRERFVRASGASGEAARPLVE